ncbi:MAG: D-alanine--D-alanine ligase [Acidobacteria bacterium]|nr:D-alanine--D-alanine ligase [Acidobacteriota bacterium]
MNKLRIAVLFGGRSGEHEVSIRSAASVVGALDRSKYEVIPLAIAQDGRWLPPAESQRLLPAEAQADLTTETAVTVSREPERTAGADVVFPVLHGTFGEDGTLQGLLELADVAYVGAGVLGSACGMDKDVMKRLFREAGLPTVEHICLRRSEIDKRWREGAERFGYPVFVKPANLGSSVGVAKARTDDELRAALEDAARYDRKLVVERGVEGREIEVSVLGNDAPEASPPGEIVPTEGFYDYDAKYVNDSAKLEIPAKLSEAQTAEVRRLAVAAFQAVEGRGLARVDFFLERTTNRFLLNEVNTMPGFTSISMYPKLWEAGGLPYPALLDRLIELALDAHRDKQATRFER